MNPLAPLSTVLGWLGYDSLPDWDPDAPEPGEVDRARAELISSPPTRDRYPVVDVREAAKAATYKNGKRKRDRYPVVDLSTRKVVIALHQAGVERTEKRWAQTAMNVTCAWGTTAQGTCYRVHPLDRRLVATNRLDRSPWHAIAIEVLGNFEGEDGSGRWYKPSVFGRGRATDAQIGATRQVVCDIVTDVRQLGGTVMGIVPHRVAGVNSRGKPNRQICCGSRVWSEVGEWAGAELGLAIPGPGWHVGGLPVPVEWRGPHYLRCERRLD